MLSRFRSFFHFFDERFEDISSTNWPRILYRDFSAGLVTALTAIPMAMGFAMASGLRPEQGIIGGAVACLVGRTFGGSKYQVYGPTAAFIPLLALITSRYDQGFLIFCSLIAGMILIAMGSAGLGRLARLVPNSIIVGFTVGIAMAIAATNLGDLTGLDVGGKPFRQLFAVLNQLSNVNLYAVALGLGTFILCRTLMRISIFIPAPLIAVTLSTVLGNTLFDHHGITLVGDRFGSIPHNFFAITLPSLPPFGARVVFDLVYFVAAIVFISGVESLLCSSMADRLAKNRGTPFNPDKEFFGQGMVQIITPLLNGLPCTGALARTATSIRAGAVTPFAGYFKGILKLAMAVSIAGYLEHIPLASIAGVLLWVATNMIKWTEIQHVWESEWKEAIVLVYTALAVPLTDFLTGVLSALILYYAWTYLQKGKRRIAKHSQPEARMKAQR